MNTAPAVYRGKFKDAPDINDFVEGTIGWLLQRYIDEFRRRLSAGHLTSLRALQRRPIAKKHADTLKPGDIIQHCRDRLAEGVLPQTVTQDITFLRGPLSYAKEGFGLEGVSDDPVEDALPLLKKYQYISKSRPRTARPTREHWDALIAHFAKQNDNPRTQIPMDVICEFQVYSARRISETCRLRCIDVDQEKRTCIVRDMKDPKFKKGNDHVFPLLGRAWDIVAERLKLWDGKDEQKLFDYNSHTCSQRFTDAKKALGIKKDLLRLHDLRREAASRLFEAGFSVQEVMLVTGHKTPNILLRVYTKLKAEDLHLGPAAKRGMQMEARQ